MKRVKKIAGFVFEEVHYLESFNILKLCKRYDKFNTVFIKKVNVSNLAVAKYAGINSVKNSDVAVIEYRGHIYYYHPKFCRWYKDLTNEELNLYFNWL